MEYDGLSLIIYPEIYEPSEDSFLLVKHTKSLKGLILEIGCGSGVVSICNARNNPSNRVVGVDINPEAVLCSRENATRNGSRNTKFYESDLFSKIPNKEKFDFILFNPPYLPTNASERLPGKLNAAFDGGRTGRKILDRFLAEFAKHLKPRGSLFLIQSSLNNLDKTAKTLEKNGFSIKILETESFFFEKLYVLEARRQ